MEKIEFFPIYVISQIYSYFFLLSVRLLFGEE